MALSRPRASFDDAKRAWAQCFLGELPQSVSDQLFEASHVEHVEAGEIVLRGTEATCFVIVEGLVRIYLRGHDGRQATIRYAQDGDVAGVPPVLAETMPVWGDTVTDTTIIRLPTERYRALAQREVSLAWATARHLSEMMVSTNETLSADIFLPVRARVARHLLDLARRAPEGLVVDARHQQIANAIGSVREVVSREMKRFADDGLIARVPGGTLLADPAALHRISMGP